MALYKRIAAASDLESLRNEADDAGDRYGNPPPEFERLLDLARLRLVARALGVKAIQRRGDEMAATLEKDHRLDPDRVLVALRAGTLVASGTDAFRAPSVFAGVSAASSEVCERAARYLAELARPGSLVAMGAETPFKLAGVA